MINAADANLMTRLFGARIEDPAMLAECEPMKSVYVSGKINREAVNALLRATVDAGLPALPLGWRCYRSGDQERLEILRYVPARAAAA